MTNKARITLRPSTQVVSKSEPTLSPELAEPEQASTTFTPQAALTEIAQLDLAALAELPDPHYKPRKQQISIRMDADVLAWLKEQPGKYQQLVNKACRIYKRLVEARRKL